MIPLWVITGIISFLADFSLIPYLSVSSLPAGAFMLQHDFFLHGQHQPDPVVESERSTCKNSFLVSLHCLLFALRCGSYSSHTANQNAPNVHCRHLADKKHASKLWPLTWISWGDGESHQADGKFTLMRSLVFYISRPLWCASPLCWLNQSEVTGKARL